MHIFRFAPGTATHWAAKIGTGVRNLGLYINQHRYYIHSLIYMLIYKSIEDIADFRGVSYTDVS